MKPTKRPGLDAGRADLLVLTLATGQQVPNCNTNMKQNPVKCSRKTAHRRIVFLCLDWYLGLNEASENVFVLFVCLIVFLYFFIGKSHIRAKIKNILQVINVHY